MPKFVIVKHFLRYISIFLLACSQFLLFSGVQYKLYPTDIVSSKTVYKSTEESQFVFYTLEEESFGEEDENESVPQFKQTDRDCFSRLLVYSQQVSQYANNRNLHLISKEIYKYKSVYRI
jgi:hypothetical protein